MGRFRCRVLDHSSTGSAKLLVVLAPRLASCSRKATVEWQGYPAGTLTEKVPFPTRFRCLVRDIPVECRLPLRERESFKRTFWPSSRSKACPLADIFSGKQMG